MKTTSQPSEQTLSIVQRSDAFLKNPRTLVALTVLMIPVTIGTTNVLIFIISLVAMISFAYRATDALINELKK